MDAVGGAASIVAMITCACQSTKVIYQTFQGIKDGPRHVHLLLLGLMELDKVLQQVFARLKI